MPLLRAARRLGMATMVMAASITMVTAPAAIAQQGPIPLFPQPGPPSPRAPEVAPEQDRRAPTAEPADRAAPPGRPAPPLEPTGDLVVEGLDAPELDAIGVGGPSEGGFDRTLWQGSDPEAVQALLADLPVVTQVPPLGRLTRRLLVTGSAVGAGRGRLLEARVARLIAIGDLDAAKTLVDQLPATAADSALARSAAEVALLSGDEEAACRLTDSVGLATAAEFWAKVEIYCRLAADDPSGARLGLDLLREARQTADTAFFELATAIAEQAPQPPLPGLAQPSAIHVALLALAEWPLPPEALAEASPPILAAVARAPRLAGMQRLAVAERAFLVGAGSADQVAALYAEQADADDAADVMRRLQSDWDADTRALVYAAVREESDPMARAELLDATWRAAEGAERFLVAEVFAEPWIELPLDQDVASVAPSAARALLAADLPVPAARWLSLLTAQGQQDSRLEWAAIRLAPLFALAGVGGSDAVPRVDVSTIEPSMPPATAEGAERLFALLEGVGVPIEADVWGELLPAPGERQEAAPASALWRGLDHAAAERRVGDTVLFALHMLNGRPEAVHPEVLVACLRALRQVGLDRDARAIAVATALIDGF